MCQTCDISTELSNKIDSLVEQVSAMVPADQLHPYKSHRCYTGFIRGICPDGHMFAKIMLCGKEWCQECGQRDSWAHKRRYGRWWGKVMGTKYLGYMVVTIPEDMREQFKDRNKLNELRRFLIRKLKRAGYSKGVCRWHWFGDCEECKGKGCLFCGSTGAGKKWHPHLNMLFPASFIAAGKLDEIKESVAKKLTKMTGLQTDVAVINYRYYDKKAHKINKLKYVTRSTFRIYNEEIAGLIKGYRNSVVWGKWPVKHENPHEPATCPICKKSITWDSAEGRKWGSMEDDKPPDEWLMIGAGVYMWKYKLRKNEEANEMDGIVVPEDACELPF